MEIEYASDKISGHKKFAAAIPADWTDQDLADLIFASRAPCPQLALVGNPGQRLCNPEVFPVEGREAADLIFHAGATGRRSRRWTSLLTKRRKRRLPTSRAWSSRPAFSRWETNKPNGG